MKYNGKIYGKIAGRYIVMTQTVEELENEIESLKNKLQIAIETIKKLEFMIENGLGYEDLKNDVTKPNEI